LSRRSLGEGGTHMSISKFNFEAGKALYFGCKCRTDSSLQLLITASISRYYAIITQLALMAAGPSMTHFSLAVFRKGRH
jgi:hypothetical protein